MNLNNFVNALLLLTLFTVCDNAEDKDTYKNPLGLVGISSAIPDTIILTHQIDVKDNEQVFIEGVIIDFAVDKQQRIFLISASQSVHKLYSFDKEGNFLKSKQINGQGPGEFEKVYSMEVHDNKIFILGFPDKYGVFDTNNLSLIYDEKIEKKSLHDIGFIDKDFIPKSLHSLEDELVVMFESMYLHAEKRERIYAKLLTNGKVSVDTLLFTKKSPLYLGKEQVFSNGYKLKNRIYVPFNRKSEVFFTSSNEIINLWTEDLAFDIHNSDGQITNSISIPFEKAKLEIDELIISDYAREGLEEMDIPKTWPAIYNVEIDELDRLWIATYTNNANQYSWWVVSLEGEILAKFILPGERNKNSPITKPLVRVYGDHIYFRKQDPNSFNYYISKHKIDFMEKS